MSKISTSEAAKVLEVSPKQVAKLANQGQLAGTKSAVGQWMFKLEDIHKHRETKLQSVPNREVVKTPACPVCNDALNVAIAHHIRMLELAKGVAHDERARTALAAAADAEAGLRLYVSNMQVLEQLRQGNDAGNLVDVTAHVKELTTAAPKGASKNRAAISKPKTWTKNRPSSDTLSSLMPFILKKLSGKKWATTTWLMAQCRANKLPHQFNAIRWALHTLKNEKRVKSVTRSDNPSFNRPMEYWEIA